MTEGTATASTAAAPEPSTDGSPPRPPKQEQEAASTEVTEVAHGVLRLQLPIDFPGLGHVNTYALEDGDGFALVDPGLPGEKSWNDLNDRLERAGIPRRRVHSVIVTHSHPDHFGGAGLLAEETGARIISSERFRTFWDFDDDELAQREPGDGSPPVRRLPNFDRPTPWGGTTEGPPPERRKQMEENIDEMLRWFRVPVPALRLADMDTISLAGREWFGLFTPGHTNDHLCLWDPEDGVMLSGDHVLPSITPHISGMVDGDPLARYVESLDRVAAFDGVNIVLPAHGHPFTDLAGRVAEMKVHHEERLDRLREISSTLGWASVVDMSHELFAPRSWGSMAESETYAHLHHMHLRGEAERREVGGKLHYLVT
ncbi:MAG: MBL fold metallo-hydrolase [Actinobacteria bacterium]|nr:MBL fold metallo-hydrolase [Actinomycetota bacterium]